MDFEKNKNYIRINGTLYKVDFNNITERKDGGYNVNYYCYNGITKNKGLMKDLLYYCISLTTLSKALLEESLQLDILDSVDNINIFEVKYITKDNLDDYRPINFDNLCNDKVEHYEKH